MANWLLVHRRRRGGRQCFVESSTSSRKTRCERRKSEMEAREVRETREGRERRKSEMEARSVHGSERSWAPTRAARAWPGSPACLGRTIGPQRSARKVGECSLGRAGTRLAEHVCNKAGTTRFCVLPPVLAALLPPVLPPARTITQKMFAAH